MKLVENASTFEGRLSFVVKRSGKVIDSYENHNLIVTSGRQRMAELLTGISSSYITHIGVGTGTDAADISDTGLIDQVLIPISSATAENKIAHFNFLIGTDAANGLQITEFGLFAGDGTMFSHRVRTGAISKESDIEIEGYWEIRF